MKGFWLLLGFVLLAVLSKAQDPTGLAAQPGYDWYKYKYLSATEGFYNAQRDTTWKPGTAGAQVYAHNTLWFWDGRQWRNPADDIRPEWFGAKGDSTTDDRAAIQEAIDYAESLKLNMIVSPQIWGREPAVVLSNKIYAIDSSIYLKVGVKIKSNGAIIKALDTMTAMLRTYVKAADYLPTAFSSRDIQITGDLYLDGNHKASYGLWTNNTSRNRFSGITVVNVDRKKWSDTRYKIDSFSVDKLYLNNNPTDSIRLGDVVRIFDSTTGIYEPGAYEIFFLNKDSGNRAVLNATIIHALDTADDHSYYLHFLPSGFHICGNQNSYTSLQAKNNTVGFFFGASIGNASGAILGYDDNYQQDLFAEDNDIGAIYTDYATSTISKATYQHSKYENLICNGNGNLRFLQLYSEADDGFASLNKEDYPLNFLSGSGFDVDAQVPINAAVGWVRPFLLYGCKNTLIRLSGHSSQSSVLENPTHAGDYAVVKMIGAASAVSLTLSGYGNLQRRDSILHAVVDDTYSFPVDNALVHGADLVNGIWLKAGIDHQFTPSEIYVGQETQPRTVLSSGDGGTNALTFGDGTNAPDVGIRRYDSVTAGTARNWKVRGVLDLEEKDGSQRYIWSDSTHRLRSSSTIPTDKNRDGSIINQNAVTTVTDSSVVTLDCNGGGFKTFRWSISADRTIPAPTNPTSGQRIRLRIQQDAIAGHSITGWNSAYNFSTAYPQPTLSTAFNAFIVVDFEYNPSSLKWDCTTPGLTSTAISIPQQISMPGTTVAASTTSYAAVGNMVTGFGTSTANRQAVCPVSGTVKGLYVKTSSAQSATGNLVVTVYKNGTATALTATIAAGASVGLFTDLTHSFSVSAGDYISIELANSATASSAGILSIAYVIQQ